MPGTHFQAARFTLWLGLVFLGLAPAVQAMESQTYVIGWFGHATNSTDDDCPEGVHQEVEYQFLENLAPLGYSPEEIEVFREKLLAGDLKELKLVETKQFMSSIHNMLLVNQFLLHSMVYLVKTKKS